MNLNQKFKLSIIINISPKKIFQTNPLFYNKIFFSDIKIRDKVIGQNSVLQEILEFNGEFYYSFLEALRNYNNFGKIVFSEEINDSPEYDINLNKYIKKIKILLSI